MTTALEQAVARRIGEPRYKLWFDRHTRFSWDDAVLTVGVPNRHFEEWLHKTFHDALTATAREVFGRPLAVRFVIDPELFQAARREQAEARPRRRPRRRLAATRQAERCRWPHVAANRTRKPRRRRPPPAERTRRWRKLTEFVVGPCNRVAHASALSVVEAPGEGANPLVLHGPVGTGKTHLLEGIYAGLRRAHPDWRVLYVTTEDFTNRFVQAMRLGKLGAFRKHFRECDALLVDDLHFLAGKRATQEEFLHTFDALLADGRQMVLTCDCHPRLADDFTPELTDRLLGGAVWGLTPPDADTRLAMLRAKAVGGREAPPPDEVLRFLAGQLRGNVRELEGALHSVRHFARVTGRPVNVAAGARGAGRSAAARGARGAAGGRGPGGAGGAAPGGRRLAEQGPRPGRSAIRAWWPCSWPASTPRRPTPRSAATSAAATTAPPSPPRRRCASGSPPTPNWLSANGASASVRSSNGRSGSCFVEQPFFPSQKRERRTLPPSLTLPARTPEIILGKLCRLCRAHLSGNFRPKSPPADFLALQAVSSDLLVTDAALPFRTSPQRAFAPGTRVGGASRGPGGPPSCRSAD